MAVVVVAVAIPARATELFWGNDGLGATGAWTSAGVNWWNGTQMVAWQDNGDAAFQGAGGAVTSYVFGPTASSLTFTTAGYTISGGWLNGGTNGLEIATIANATISSVLNDGSPFDSLGMTKRGSGTLTVTSTNFFDHVQVAEGEYVGTSTSAVFFSEFRVETNAKLTLAPTSSNTISVGSIAGDGIVQPDAQVRTVEATLFGVHDFTGTLQDNGAGVLAVDFFLPSTGSMLLNAATYTGTTQITAGTLKLSASGAIKNSASIAINPGAKLLAVQEGYASSDDRLGDAIPVQLKGGTLEISRESGSQTEDAGALSTVGGGHLALTSSGGSGPAIRFSSFERLENGTLNISDSSNGAVTLTGMANGSFGIVTPAITMNNEWVTADGTGKLFPFTAYATQFTGGTSTDNVKISTPSLSVTGSVGRASLNLSSNNAGVDQTVTLNGQLTLLTGGLLSSGSQASTLTGGTLLAPSELLITNANQLTISSTIGAGSSFALTKSGAGTLILTNQNSYSGVTTINDGILAISSPSALGYNAAVVFGGGTLQARGNFTLTKDLVGIGGGIVKIDTGNYSVTATGSLSGGVSKSGAGFLSLTQSQLGSVYVTQGALDASNAASGRVTLEGGTDLFAAGYLDELSLFGKATLGIGATNSASTLTINRLSFSGSNGSLTVEFSLGSAIQDMLVIKSPFTLGGLAPGAFLFAFSDLGGLSVGVDYTVLSFGSPGSALNASNFALAPGLINAGWQATFQVDPQHVTVNFSAIPEPAPVALMVFGLAAAGLTLRQRRRNR